ncbi:Arabidopsis NAC domain containing protein 104, xylem NAC domain 1 [Hibiscus trionum]|uniref:Arabidopsis NAC domain containing protein 104, xylem NAC domain 1 n=1 Tax=Hibiscus trionum TaxID=183268 RepID=A0A9W7I0G9_HIBTR|nr:Arabidopsis NAC domain containing protein 104, xylem NAC domain 1 [Hibiscus trionum]
MEDGCLVLNQLPPGFQFCPTDEELLLHFLYPKSSRLPCYPNIIPELDLHLLHPWELHGKALLSGNQYFFFSQMMENRVLENGYWKQLDNVEEPILCAGSGKKVGVKKVLEFYIGEAPFGMKTNWLMQEYHLCNWGSGSASALSSHYCKTKGHRKADCSKWVVCKVEEKKGNAQSLSCSDEDGSELSCLDEMFLSLDDDLDDISSSKIDLLNTIC